MDFNLNNLSSDKVYELVISYGMNFIGAIIIIAIGFWLSSKLSKVISRRVLGAGFTISMKKFLQSLISILLKILVVLVAMSTVGFEVTAFIAVLGGLAVGIGMALQGSLSNLAGGILILLFKPFKVGDFVESIDKTGTVEEISILQTVLLTPDMRTIILPNGSVFNNPIINFSKHGIRRVEIEVGISYDDDFDRAKEVLLQVLKDEPLMLDEKGYTLEINEFGDNSINLAMYGYTETKNYLSAKWKLNSATKKALDSNGFNIPYPQRDLHIISAEGLPK